MPRYFLEVAYKGNRYSGFQVQENAISIQGEVERALTIFLREGVSLTGSSRTDAGVHALQNYFHFDTEVIISNRNLYNINAILPEDIVVKRVIPVGPEAHCRFDAIAREYRYYIYRRKDPFLADRAYFFPYKLDFERMNEAAAVIRGEADFSTFSKRNTQVKTFICKVEYSAWGEENGCWVYRVIANRFLRGMVRGLVGTMLQVGRGKITVDMFANILKQGDNRQADFAVPGHGLTLCRVYFPVSVIEDTHSA